MAKIRIGWALAFFGLMIITGTAQAGPLPAPGEWDGTTESAKLVGPYEDTVQATVQFGIGSYFNSQWRSYMDTWPASHFTSFCATQWNIDRKYSEPVCQLFQECGIRSIRYEIGWGSMNWNDDLPEDVKANMKRDFAIFQKHGIRPLILLNAHHGQPCPVRDVQVEVVTPAKKGDRTIKLKDASGVHLGYTGPMHPDYISSYPLIISADADGTAHLSAPLPFDVKAGPWTLRELKYQPFQGVKLKDGTAVPAAQESFNGWLKYAASIGRAARESLGTEGKPDAGFDIEVWNEQTFGANFLNINNYYDEKKVFAEEFSYRRTRPMKLTFRPGARTNFEVKGCYAILPMTIDYFNDLKNGFPGVHVISGFANQWPWDNGTELWDGQAGFSRHYYTGGWVDVSPDKPIYPGSGSVDALGSFDGKKDNRDWHTIVPGSSFIPTLRIGLPELCHFGYRTETLSRDVIPDSRLTFFNGHGRYTHNGDYRPAEVWQTEVNYDRNAFIDAICKEAKVTREDPRLTQVALRLAGKTFLRQYFFHAHKGLYRIFIFSPQADVSGIGLLPPAFYTALDKNEFKLNDDVRKTIPPEFLGLQQFMKLADSGEKLVAPRALTVQELVEYKPRLVFAGKDTPAFPNRWNRDYFAFLPFQISSREYVIPYYVVTLDICHAWQKDKDVLDPSRYDMPDQEYDVTIGNIAGKDAVISGYDPLSLKEVPVKIIAAAPNSLTVRLPTADYPRWLKVTEKEPGPQILNPKVEVTGKGEINVSWSTNIPVKAEVTYGRGWQNRGANVMELSSDLKKENRVVIPPGLTGEVAVRIRVSAKDLTASWPRWDEDPQGIVVVPGSGGETTTANTGTAAPQANGTATGMPKPSGPVLALKPTDDPLKETENNAARGYTMKLPAGMTLAGPADNRTGSLAAGKETVSFRIKFVPGGASGMGDYLPVTSVTDTVKVQSVNWPDYLVAGTLVSISMAQVAHPDMANLNQTFLMVPRGKEGSDLLVISATGSPAAMKAQGAVLNAIFSSMTFTGP